MNDSGPKSTGKQSEVTADLELLALKKLIAARCRQIEVLARTAFARSEADAREREFQFQVFAERRTQAMDQMVGASGEPAESRAARLERLLRALECSLEYFRVETTDAAAADDRSWAVRIR